MVSYSSREHEIKHTRKSRIVIARSNGKSLRNKIIFLFFFFRYQWPWPICIIRHGSHNACGGCGGRTTVRASLIRQNVITTRRFLVIYLLYDRNAHTHILYNKYTHAYPVQCTKYSNTSIFAGYIIGTHIYAFWNPYRHQVVSNRQL